MIQTSTVPSCLPRGDVIEKVWSYYYSKGRDLLTKAAWLYYLPCKVSFANILMLCILSVEFKPPQEMIQALLHLIPE